MVPLAEVKSGLASEVPVMLFASRIARMKERREAIMILSHLKSPFDFHIHGDMSVPIYGRECLEAAEATLSLGSWS
jgi:hypothetical protein